jgi:hypothetical protein
MRIQSQQPATEALEQALQACGPQVQQHSDKFTLDCIFQATSSAKKQIDMPFPSIAWLDDEDDCMKETINNAWKTLTSEAGNKRKLPSMQGRMVRSGEISSKLSKLASQGGRMPLAA